MQIVSLETLALTTVISLFHCLSFFLINTCAQQGHFHSHGAAERDNVEIGTCICFLFYPRCFHPFVARVVSHVNAGDDEGCCSLSLHPYCRVLAQLSSH